MMELTCAYVLIIVSSVCASPYGYGTKGGAIAKAEASATAGTSGGLSGVPYRVPTGAGFSGSFSKSSSSSFASSSASSSSSSSSYSFSGTGTGAQHGLVPNGGTGCVSGGCQVSGANGITHSHGSNTDGISKAFSGANAAATNGIIGTESADAAGTSQAFNGPQSAGTNGITGTHGTGASGISQAYSGAEVVSINGITSTPGASSSGTGQAYSGANAAATAAVGHLAGSLGPSKKEGNAACIGNDCSNAPLGCTDLSCNDISTGNKCASGQCGQSGISTSEINSDTKCTSGQCGASGPGVTGSPSSNIHNSNDIPAKMPATSVSQNSKEQHSNYDKTSTLNEATSGSGCSYGNCGSLVPSNLKPIAGQGSSSSYQNSGINQGPKCDSPNCNTYDYNANSMAIGVPTLGNHKIATYLTTPKLGSSCTSSECQLKPGISFEKPSSYNVPIHGNYDHTEQKIPSAFPGAENCNGGICDYHQHKGPHTVGGTNTLSLNIPTGPSGTGSNCASGKCPSSPSTFDFNGPKLPPYSQGSLLSYSPTGSTYKLPTAPSTSTCATSNCAPSYNAGSEHEPNKHVAVPSRESVTAPHTNPSYVAPGFGHPSHNAPLSGIPYSNCNTPNCAVSPGNPSGEYSTSGSNNPSFTSSGQPSYNGPTFEVTIPSCGSPNCAKNPSLNAGSQIGNTLHPTLHAVSPHIPSVSETFSSPSKYPSYSSSVPLIYNTPNVDSTSSSCKTPHCAGYPSANAGASSHTDQNLPAYTNGFGGPAGFLQPNEFTANHYSNADSISHMGTVGIAKPIAGLNPSTQEHPTYTSGFGGPSGILKPNEFSSGTLPTNTGAATGSPFGASSTHQKQPAYTGVFGAPSGLLKPNELNPSHSTANIDVTGTSNAASASFARPSTATTGNFGSPSQKPNEFNADNPSANAGTTTGSESFATGLQQPIISSNSFGQHHPAYTGGFNAPSGILKPDKFSSSHPIADTGIPAISHTGSVDITKPSASSTEEKLPPYTGGFGGAAGILRPDEFSIPTSNINKNPPLVSIYNPIACSSGNCGSQSIHSTPAHMHAGETGGAQSSAEAVAKAEAIAYSGGFGGPPGLLKPYDGGKLQNGGLATGGKLFLGSQIDIHHGAANDGVKTTGGGISTTGTGGNSPYSNNNINKDASGPQADIASKATATAQASAVAQSTATAGASSGAYGSSSGAYGNQANIHGSKHESVGCGGGCGSNAGDTNLGHSRGLGWSKTGFLDNSSAAAASAKSTAGGAISGARAFGVGGGSFASSSASAHASSGFPTKGGYGR